MPAKMSGVENTNVPAIRPALKTLFRFPAPERVARMPSAMPKTPAVTAPHPSRRSPRVIVQIPKAIARIPTRIGHRIVRVMIGGMARKAAKMPSRSPATPYVRGRRSRSQNHPSRRP